MAKKITEDDANMWIMKNDFDDRFKIISWSGKSTEKSLFKDIKRDVFFRESFTIFKRNLKRNPETIFNPSKNERKKLIEDSNIRKYGKSHYSKTNEYKDRVRKTNLEKYGVTNVMKSDKFKEKLQETTMKRYGVSHYSKTEEFSKRINQAFEKKSEEELQKINKKRIETIKKRYGEKGLKHQDIRSKAIKTNIEKYGKENPRQSKEIEEKIKKTNLERYGHEYAQQSNSVKEKIKKTMILRGHHKQYQKKSLKEWADEIGFSRTHFNKLVNDLGFEKAIMLTPQESSLETIVKQILSNIGYSEDFYSHNRKLGSYRPDFQIMNQLVIECDGLFWHSDSVIEDKSYHKQKRDHYKKSGFDSLFFREDEILKKGDIVSSIIRNRLKKSKKYYARKLNVKLLSHDETRKFFEDNHLMGNGTGRTYALLGGDEIFCGLQVRWKNKEQSLLDISRFCTKMNHSVVGGWSKLIKHATKKERPKIIQTFVDQRYGSGRYLVDLGWVLESNFLSFRWTNGFESFHRMKFPGNSGYDHGLAKIWDCGQAKYVKHL